MSTERVSQTRRSPDRGIIINGPMDAAPLRVYYMEPTAFSSIALESVVNRIIDNTIEPKSIGIKRWGRPIKTYREFGHLRGLSPEQRRPKVEKLAERIRMASFFFVDDISISS